jgi:uncharacterized membrane protein
MADSPKSSPLRTVARVTLGGALVFAGASHLTFARQGFRAQVPRKLAKAMPFGKDDVVLMSGIVEMGLGAALIVLPKERHRIGSIAGAFFTAIYPGNISQTVRHDSSLGLDTDQKRAVRLVFQPLLVAWALWSTRTPTSHQPSTPRRRP